MGEQVPAVSDDVSAQAKIDFDDASAQAKIDFIVRLGEALHRYGAAAHQLEQAMTSMASSLGLSGAFFSTPTMIMASFRVSAHESARMVRAQPGDADLEKLSLLDALGQDVANGAISLAAASAELEAVIGRPARYGIGLTAGSFAVASGSVAVFLGGGWLDLVASAFVGLLIGAFAVVQGRFERLSGLHEALAALGASVCAGIIAVISPHVSAPTVTLAGLIVLIPGLSITIAMAELATKNLVSGTARFMGSVTVLLKMTFGMALGSKLMAMLPIAASYVATVPVPQELLFVALPCAGAAFCILFQAHPRDMGWVFLAAVVGFSASKLGTVVLGPELGGFVGGFAVGAASNAFSRWRERPASIMLLPGIILLVPGSIGYRSLNYLFENNVLPGVESAFTVLIVAVALVAGLLFGNLAVPPRRSF